MHLGLAISAFDEQTERPVSAPRVGRTAEEIEEALMIVGEGNQHWQECIRSGAPPPPA